MLSTHYFLTTFRQMQWLTDYFYSGLSYSRNHTGYTHFAIFTEVLYNFVLNDYFSTQQ